MAKAPRIAMIHATRLAIEPIEAAIGTCWPEAESISILDESLSTDRAKSEALSDELFARIGALARYAENAAPRGILFTCSAFGEAIEAAASASDLPVMKPNEAMFDAAFGFGDRVAMIYTFRASASGMVAEFQDEAKRRGRDAVLTPVFCEGAMDAKRNGDVATHNQQIADTAGAIRDADVILLAQFSMASAAAAARARTDIPVLSAPQAAVEEMRRRVSPELP